MIKLHTNYQRRDYLGKIIDIIGHKYGKLTVIKRVSDYITPAGDKYIRFLCKCDCGKNKEVNSTALRRGKTKSCGCLISERGGKRLPSGEASIRDLYRNYKFHAKQINLPFKLSDKFFREITRMNCFYCGVPPLQIWKPHKRTNGTYIYNAITPVVPVPQNGSITKSPFPKNGNISLLINFKLFCH